MKFFNLVIIITGIMILLNISGFITPVTGGMMGALGIVDTENTLDLSDVKDSDLYSGDASGNPGLKYVLLSFLGAGIVLGAFGRSPDTRYITAVLVWALLGYLTSDIISIFNLTSSIGEMWIKVTLSIILGICLVALYVSALSYWQGSDG